MHSGIWLTALFAAGLCGRLFAQGTTTRPAGLTPPFRWVSSGPLIWAADRPEDPCWSVKDPTVVHYDGAWHLFCTIRSQKRTHQIEYIRLADLESGRILDRQILTFHDEFFCAPQVFYFTPHRKWYLIYQASEPSREREPYGPYFSTTDNIADPKSWTRPQRLVESKPAQARAWLDFWVICDQTRAHLFFTSLDGKMWRMETRLEDFPRGWGEAQIALQGDIFEASHTYKVKGTEQYLTIIEAQGGGGRYYKAYVADALDGAWRPLADTFDRPFAGPRNVLYTAVWSDSISHGELIRAGRDEKMEIDPARLELIYQGVKREDYTGRPYGQIPWRLGMLTLERR